MNVKETDYDKEFRKRMGYNWWTDLWCYQWPFYRIIDIKFWVRNRVFKRHDLIRTGLNKAQWWDIDSKLLYGTMQLLVDYVDKEKCFELINWDGDVDHHHVSNEIKNIYEWWKNYHNRKQEIEHTLNIWYNYAFDKNIKNFSDQLNNIKHDETEKKLNKQYYDLEQKLENEETDMLIRFVKIRKYLWT